MASVLNKITKQYIASANTPDFDPKNWLINPDLSAVQSVDPKYWVIENDAVRRMTRAEATAAFLGETKNAKKQVVNDYRDKLIHSGYNYAGHTFDSDQYSSLKIIGATLISFMLKIQNQNLPSDFVWRDYNNVDVPMDAPTLIDFGSSLFNYGVAVYKASWAHKANIDALTTIDDIDQYDITTGWPAN